MSRINNLNVFQRIAAGYLLILLILVALGAVTFSRVLQLRGQVQNFSGQVVPALNALDDLTSQIYLEEIPIERYKDSPLSGSAREDLLAPYYIAKSAINRDVAALGAFAAENSDVVAPLAAVKAAVGAREVDAESDVAIVRADPAAVDRLANDYVLIGAIQSTADRLASDLQTRVAHEAASANTDALFSLVLIAILFVGGVLFTVVAGVLAARSISRPLAILTATAERISSGERIDPPVLDRHDEIGILSAALSRMVRSLRELAAKERALTVDLAEHKRVQDELQRSNAELEQFAYVASHDLQEPLRMVGSYTGLLKRRYRGKLDAEADEFIDYAMDGVTRMRALINDLLTYSRLGREERPLEPTDSRAALDRALANLEASIKERGAVVAVGQLPTVMGNFSQLTQLFQNLVGNGLKFCKENQPEIHVEAERSGAEWIFSVRDNGIGIDPQYRERIFLIFQRLHKREEYAGTGIGLAICRKVVEQHGGRIWVDSEPGKGATFRFTLRAMDRLELAA